MSLQTFLHTLLLGLLTVSVGGLGPAALIVVPRSLTVNLQEEERNSGESAQISSLGTSVLRPARPSAPARRTLDRQSWSCDARRLLSTRLRSVVADSLCALHVRIQV